MSTQEKKSEESAKTVGCGVITLVIGLVFFLSGWFSLGSSTRPIGTIGSLILGGLLGIVGIVRIAIGIATKRWKLQ